MRPQNLTLKSSLSGTIGESKHITGFNSRSILFAENLNLTEGLLCPGDGGPCFFVPLDAFSNATLGITDELYAQIPLLCERPLIGGESMDQMKQYRSNQGLSGELGWKTSALSSTEVAFEVEAQTSFVRKLDDVGQNVSPYFSLDTSVISKGVRRLSRISIGVGVVFHNDGAFEQDYSVSLVGCNYPILGIGDSTPLRLDADSSRFVEIPVVALDPKTLNSSFSCRIAISSFQNILQTVSVDFSDRIDGSFSRRWLRNTECTIDQVEPNCDPVDCFSKYLLKTFYNPDSGVCEYVADCYPNEVYNPATNMCSINGNTPSYDPPVVVPPEEDIASLNCNSGRFNAETMECDCFPEWTTDLTQPFDSFEYCTILVLAHNSSAAGVEQAGVMQNGSPVVISNFTLIVILISLIVGSIILCCVACCICKVRKRAVQRKRQRVTYSAAYNSMCASYLQVSESIPDASEGLREFEFNFDSHDTLETHQRPQKSSKKTIREQIDRCVRNRERVWFKIDETSTIPGVLVKGRPLVHFLTASGHPFAATMPVTPLTLEETERFVDFGPL